MSKNNRHGKAAILSDSDLGAIEKQLTQDWHKLFWAIARWTGERWGAICRLKVSDVFSDGKPRDEITFRKITRKADPSGMRFTRQVPVHPLLEGILKAYQPPAGEWLFPSPVIEGQPITFKAVDKFLREALAKAGMSSRGVSTHSTRRTLITRLNRKGIDIKTIQVITGHRSLKVLAEYIEEDPEQVKAAISTL